MTRTQTSQSAIRPFCKSYWTWFSPVFSVVSASGSYNMERVYNWKTHVKEACGKWRLALLVSVISCSGWDVSRCAYTGTKSAVWNIHISVVHWLQNEWIPWTSHFLSFLSGGFIPCYISFLHNITVKYSLTRYFISFCLSALWTVHTITKADICCSTCSVVSRCVSTFSHVHLYSINWSSDAFE